MFIVVNMGEKPIYLRVTIKPELHMALKVKAAKEGKTLKALIVELLEEGLKEPWAVVDDTPEEFEEWKKRHPKKGL